MSEAATLRRVQVREILHRHRGSIKDIAENLKISSAAVGIWLSGRSTSARVAAAATRKAMQLLDLERATSADTSAHEDLKRTA